MHNIISKLVASLLVSLICVTGVQAPAVLAENHSESSAEEKRWSIAIHGGAGTLERSKMTPERQAAYEAALQEALDAGKAVLAAGGSAMDAVKAAIIPMEDSPLFNAGRGAVFTWEGRNELDASIMDGRDRSAGAVTGVTTIKNPILLADAVRTDSPHVFMMGEGAEGFAATQEIETAGPEWFATEARREALERLKAKQLSALDVDHKFGTVGAVALDMDGNLAAGTSTGGMTGKRWGRIGDAPVIGAGTYADNRSCAVSATGWGEYFIRVGVAQEICTRLRYRVNQDIDREQAQVPRNEDGRPQYIIHAYEMPLSRTSAQDEADAVMAEVKELGGDGGVILVTPEGHTIFSFNTSGMYRGRANSDGLNEVAIFGGDPAADAASATPDH
ncbi:MAG: isoaspartyl peptidase/L-asparaginase [Pseudomonadota bacterium]